MAVNKKSLENLKKIDENMTHEDRVENGRKGGKKSGEVRRAKKEMRDLVADILQMNIKAGTPQDFKNLAESKGKNISVNEALVLAQVKKAMAGDTKAFAFLLQQMDAYNEKERAEIEVLKAKAKGNIAEEKPDDGFLEALSDTAEEDWSDDE